MSRIFYIAVAIVLAFMAAGFLVIIGGTLIDVESVRLKGALAILAILTSLVVVPTVAALIKTGIKNKEHEN